MQDVIGLKTNPGSFSTDNERWEAIVRRDSSADGNFYYSVLTTGVYCQPSCAARLAHRKNVQFHMTCAEAENAGFRPCKRCRPNEGTLAERRAAAVAIACRAIEEADENPSLDQLAMAAGMSRFHFHRVFKSLTGLTPKVYADAHRSQRLHDELKQDQSITEAIYGAGFNSSGRFYATSFDLLGMTATAFRTGGTGESIYFAVGECWLGSILVAATQKGVCAISFGDDPDALVRDIQDRFPKSEIVGNDSVFARIIATVVGFVEAPSMGLDLPLDVRGTAFQQRVWQALREIPPGSTTSYAEIAKHIDQPKAMRAVAQACASNPIAVAIPCHRVVRSDGGLSGYRWGIDRKRALLHREASS